MQTPSKVYVVEEDGSIVGLHDDDMILPGATQEIERASIVEPNPNGTWFVRLTDAARNGKWAGHLVGDNYPTRTAALAAEVEFINKNILLEGVL